jgi:hypothetical protein
LSIALLSTRWWSAVLTGGVALLDVLIVARIRQARIRDRQTSHDLWSTAFYAERAQHDQLLTEVTETLRDEARVAANNLLHQADPRQFAILTAEGLVEQRAQSLLAGIQIDAWIRGFIKDNETGAIGLAGPRGIGKSTLLESLIARPELKRGADAPASDGYDSRPRPVPKAILLSAPVRYEQREFLLFLFGSLCRDIARDVGPPSRTSLWPRLWRWALVPLLLAGGLIIVLSFYPMSSHSAARLAVAAAVPALMWYVVYVIVQVGRRDVIRAVQFSPNTSYRHQPLFRWVLLRNTSLCLAIAATLAFGEIALSLWTGHTTNTLRFVGITLLCVAAGLLVPIYRGIDIPSWLEQDYAKSRSERSEPLSYIAAKQLDSIVYQQKLAKTQAATFKLPRFGLEASRSVQIAREERPKPLPELVEEFRTFVTLITQPHRSWSSRQDDNRYRRVYDPGVRDPGYQYVLVGVDELDKIEVNEKAIDFLNDLKGLFQIPRCFFTVSVSLNALYSFNRRGVPLRDAFDSAFDQVEELCYWTLAESQRLLAERVVGMPDLAYMFCHAHAGGLPRDLIRVARRLIERDAVRGGKSMLPVLVDDLIGEDVRDQLEAALAVASDVHNLETLTTVVAFRALVQDPKVSEAGLLAACGSGISAGATEDSERSKPKELFANVYALVTLRQVFGSSGGAAEGQGSPELMSEVSEIMAKAKQAMSVTPSLAWMEISRARVKSGLSIPGATFGLEDWRDPRGYI